MRLQKEYQISPTVQCSWGSPQVVLEVKNPPANARDTRDAGLIPGSERSLRNGNLLQNSCLQNVLDRVSWRATVHGVARSQTWLSTYTHTHTHTHTHTYPSTPTINMELYTISLFCLNHQKLQQSPLPGQQQQKRSLDGWHLLVPTCINISIVTNFKPAMWSHLGGGKISAGDVLPSQDNQLHV